MTSLSQFPFPFWAACMVAVGAGLWFWKQRRLGFGIPALAVLGTVAVWYFGDALYNDYAVMRESFGDETLSAAWWQVALFLGSFALLTPLVHRSMNRRLKSQHSEVLLFAARREIDNPAFQKAIDQFLAVLLCAWAALMAVALTRVNFDFTGLFLPWMGHRANPWGRDRIGGGLDAILSLSAYVQVFLTAAFGIVAGVSRNPRTRFIALLICAIAIPYYLFDRTRNTMISTIVPGVLAWVFLGLRGNIIVRFAILAAAFLALEGWLSFVIKSRGEGKNVAGAFAEAGAKDKESKTEDEGENAIKPKTKHDGLNMFEELAWINTFIESGDYLPNGGQRYFAELVNPIPRSLWPGKPLIGIDYAKARGFGGGSSAGAGVVASVSTGMIGQGITNFGRFFGTIAAALIMAGWVGMLARQDLLSLGEPARLLLYGLGLVLTFNLGRDVTLLVLYPFLFGFLLFWVWKSNSRKPSTGESNVAIAEPKVGNEDQPQDTNVAPVPNDEESLIQSAEAALDSELSPPPLPPLPLELLIVGLEQSITKVSAGERLDLGTKVSRPSLPPTSATDGVAKSMSPSMVGDSATRQPHTIDQTVSRPSLPPITPLSTVAKDVSSPAMKISNRPDKGVEPKVSRPSLPSSSPADVVVKKVIPSMDGDPATRKPYTVDETVSRPSLPPDSPADVVVKKVVPAMDGDCTHLPKIRNSKMRSLREIIQEMPPTPEEPASKPSPPTVEDLPPNRKSALRSVRPLLNEDRPSPPDSD